MTPAEPFQVSHNPPFPLNRTRSGSRQPQEPQSNQVPASNVSVLQGGATALLSDRTIQVVEVPCVAFVEIPASTEDVVERLVRWGPGDSWYSRLGYVSNHAYMPAYFGTVSITSWLYDAAFNIGWGFFNVYACYSLLTNRDVSSQVEGLLPRDGGHGSWLSVSGPWACAYLCDWAHRTYSNPIMEWDIWDKYPNYLLTLNKRLRHESQPFSTIRDTLNSLTQKIYQYEMDKSAVFACLERYRHIYPTAYRIIHIYFSAVSDDLYPWHLPEASVNTYSEMLCFLSGPEDQIRYLDENGHEPPEGFNNWFGWLAARLQELSGREYSSRPSGLETYSEDESAS